MSSIPYGINDDPYIRGNQNPRINEGLIVAAIIAIVLLARILMN